MIDQYPSQNGVLTSLIWRKTAAGGETSLSGYDNANQALSYTPGQEQVYLNGILLVRGDDYTATNGTSITGLSALAASDFVQVNCYNNFSVATLPTSGLTGTISNAQLQNSAITINGNSVSLGGSVSLPGDIESVTASSPLTGGGTSGAVTIGIQSASTSQSGAVQLTDSTSSTSTSTAATPNSVKSAYDLANGAIQKTLTTTTGDIIYASAANTPSRLGIGSTGQVLTVSGGIPAWSTPSSGGWTLLSTTNLSGTTTQPSITSTGYTQLSIWIVNYYSGASGYPNLRINGDATTGNYRYNGVYSQQTTHAVAGDTNATNIPMSIGGAFQDGVDIKAIGILTIWNPNSSTSYKPFTYVEWCGGQSGEKRVWNIAGGWGNLNPVTSIACHSGSGVAWAGGQILVYGVK